MHTSELIIWVALLGALLSFATAAAVNVVRHRNGPARRGLFFVLSVGGSAVLLSGLLEFLLGITGTHQLLFFKAVVPALASALALAYLGVWFDIVLEDKLMARTVAWGTRFLVAAGTGLGLWVLLAPSTPAFTVLSAGAVVGALSVVFGITVSVRGAALGDPLGRAMAAACFCMAGMVAGLYAKALQLPGAGNPVWALTAVCTLAYFLTVVDLTTQRARQLRRLQKLANGSHTSDRVTGLPTGAKLMEQVDDALWRSARANREAAVIAVWVNNLYELSAQAGVHVDHEIRASLTARLRRAVGFRNVVGLHHQRCFVVVVSAVQDERAVRVAVQRLRHFLLPPMLVGALSKDDHTFTPELSIGVVRVPAGSAEPLEVLDDAEQLAQAARAVPGGVAIRVLGEKVATPLADYIFAPAHRYAVWPHSLKSRSSRSHRR